MKRLLPVFFLLIAFSGCIHQEQVVNFQDINFTTDKPVEFQNKNSEYHLQPNDILSVNVRSHNQQVAADYNSQLEGQLNGFNQVSLYVTGYSIDEDGNIQMLGVGPVKVEGKTVPDAQRAIQAKVREFVPDATVTVSMVSFKFSVIGEVQTPGYYYVYNNQCNILEAMALAGDTKEFADRKSVQLTRQSAKGSEVVLLDLTKSEIYTSPYFYLKPNDVLYFPPLEARTKRSNLAALNVVSLTFSALTTVATIVNIYLSNKKTP